MTVAGDMTFGIVYNFITGQTLEISAYNTANVAVGCVGTAVIGSIYMVLLVCYVKRKSGDSLYIPVLGVLLAVFICAGMTTSQHTEPTSYDAALIFAIACVSIFLYLCLCIFFALLHMKNIKKEHEEFLRALEIEQAKYEAIEMRRDELAKLRHDYRNMLMTVTVLLKRGNTQEAKELLADMSQRANDVHQ